MAADRPLAERGFVEVKMGRSKFPGKPSKIGNRKRVNLSSCALPEENDSSKAAKNIYLGLSVFNETFGDNEMVAPGPFHGFSTSEVEEAMAEARLQQNEAELEHKKQGINLNFWESFQKELFSIMSCSPDNNTNIQQLNKTKLSFDGGGSGVNDESIKNCTDSGEKQPSKASALKSSKGVKNFKVKNTPLKNTNKVVKFHSPRLKLKKLPCSPGSSKSLQSQAAKRLLEKAKMSNTLESNKCSSAEKKFILPNYSIHSSRVIKPNKKFLEENANKRKFLRSRTVNGASECKKAKVMITTEEVKSSSDKKQTEELETKTEREESPKRTNKSESTLSESKLPSSVKNSSQISSTGKIILREARLQLDNSNLSLLEGPFSSPSASSLSPNSQLKINSVQSGSASGSEVCGVCGVVRFYKIVDLTKKFGIYCCESCQKFILKMIRSYSLNKNLKLQCVRGKNLCGILPIVKSQHLNTGTYLKNTRCQACWLKLCLKNLQMPIKLKQKLLKLLPVNMQLGISLEMNPILSNDINSRFSLSNNIKDFKWLKENRSNASQIKFISNEKQKNWTSTLDSVALNEKSLRKRNRGGSENLSKLLTPGGKGKAETDEKNRQSIALKGPRVKHVCRSASVVLGQPLATFPSETSPTKKLANESVNDCKNCDNLVTTNNFIETQGVVEKSDKEISSNDLIKHEKKANVSKQASNTKGVSAAQPNPGTKSKRKGNVKTENPVSMDFWECYDPDEVSETGFGLIGSETFSVRALCFLCGSSGLENFIHCASCCEPYHEFCVNEGQLKLQDGTWKYDWVCPRCTVCFTCGKTSGQQLKCIKCDNSYHTECVDRVGGRLLYSPDRPWVCSVCLRCKSCNGVDVSVFVGNLPLCKACFILRQKGNYCPLCQRCYEDDDYDSKMMECGQCKCWVHAKCEGLSDEKYQVLSFLPESVEYVCRMCCAMPPAPWWIAVEAELKSGYLGVLKALSKNRKACTMLKWSPRKQCTCRQVSSVSRSLDFEDPKYRKPANDSTRSENTSAQSKDESKFLPQDNSSDKVRDEKYQPAGVGERKTSIEIISHPTESLKLTLKIMKGSDTDEKEKAEPISIIEDTTQVKQISKDNTVRVKKCLSNDENSEDSLINAFDCPEESQISLHSLFKGTEFGISQAELPDKRLLSSPNPPSDSGIGSTDDELKASCLTDEESCKLDDQQSGSSRIVGTKPHCDSSVSFLDEKRECFCFLEVDTYNSRSKPFSPNLMSIKKKVTTSEYTSLHQFHHDMQGMIGTTQSVELMDLYHQTMKEIFPWFDPKYSRVQSNSQKVSGTMSLESTPVKSTPTKYALLEECKIPKEKLVDQCLSYFYSDYVVEDNRICLMCKTVGDGPPGETGRLLYCGQNEWVHCNCALWSGEVFEEIDGSLQNVHSAISRGRSIRCPECGLKGASIGCCARNCQETYHFRCARQVGCIFMDDKTVYCPAHVKESAGKLVQNEKEFEIRRPVYVELDKRKMKTVDSSQIRFAVGALHVNNLGKFVVKLSDQSEAIIPEQFDCTRLFWSCFEPWRIVRYHFSVRLLDLEEDEGVDCGVNFTIDHSLEPELIELKLKQLRYFQEHNVLLDISDKLVEQRKSSEEIKTLADEGIKNISLKRPKKDHKVVKRIFDQFDSRDDENCLSDNQNTADLLPPDLEEAIFRDLPNDILDGISMQDIFMDIKNDSYDVNAKEGLSDEADAEDISENLAGRSKKQEFNSETSQLDFWVDANESKQDVGEETFSKTGRDLKKCKYEALTNQQVKKSGTLRTYQKSCSYNWNCKTEGASKWKKNPKCHVTVNLLEAQERGNMLQELKFTDGLVTVSTGAIDSVKDLKARLEDKKCSIQQEEGKENKCLPWHTHLQPRLLQVDGGVDSSSSGSEAGESPQRLMDENINSKIVSLPQSSPYFDSLDYPLNSPLHSVPNPFVPTSESHTTFPKITESHNQFSKTLINNLPQLDGVTDFCSDGSDSEDLFVASRLQLKRPRKGNIITNNQRAMCYKINQCDGGEDSESDDGEFSPNHDLLPLPLEMSQTKDEPVKCKQCHCTYRTKISYQRHLETCCSDFILSSSDGEISDEESPKKPVASDDCLNVQTEVPTFTVEAKVGEIKKETLPPPVGQSTGFLTSEHCLEDVEKPEVKKERVTKRTYSKKKLTPNAKKPPIASNVPQVQQILVQQPNVPPTLIVQDLPGPNMMPGAFNDSGSTIRYVTTVDPQIPYGKLQLIATSNGIISGGFQFPSAPEPHIVGGLCLNPQTMQTNIPGIIIQPPQQTGPVISSQPGPVLMSNEQMMLGPTGLYDVIQDPGTGGMYLASHNQPMFYNMETIVSNTVMQTNQFVSNVLATSYSQTSTQIFQAREMEQVVNFPPNYIVLASNPPAPDKILPSDALICVQTPQTLIPNQTPIQIPSQPIFGASFQTPQPINPEPKLIPTHLNPIRCLQPLQVKQLCPSIVMNKVSNGGAQMLSQPVAQVYRATDTNPVSQNAEMKSKPVVVPVANTGSNTVRSVPMMRPNVSKSSPKGYEKAVVTPKSRPQVQVRSRALVDYINNFRSDTCDIFSVKDSPQQNQKMVVQQSVESSTMQPVVVNGTAACFLESKQAPERVVPSVISKPSSEFFGKTYGPKTHSGEEKTQVILPERPMPSPTAPIPVPPEKDNIQRDNLNVIIKPTDPIHIEIDKLPKVLSPAKKLEPENTKTEKDEASDCSSKVLSNISNSFAFEKETDSNLSLPCLEDFSPTCQEEQNCSSETIVLSEKQNSEILPLQDGSHSLNTGCKQSSKSPQKLSPVKTRSPPSDEKNKQKKKIDPSDQNSLDSELLPENVNELKREEPSVKNGDGGLFSFQKKNEEKGPKLIFDVISDDGFKSSSTSMVELWENICNSVQEMRAVLKIPPLPVSRKGHEILGMQNHGLQHCLEQLKGVEHCVKYKCKYFVRDPQKMEDDETALEKENLSGCARTEKFTARKEYDMFAWLASKHRQLPKLTESAEETLSSIRRANSLPMAMRYRNLKETAKLYVGVYRSKIHGRGLFCLREIEAGEMVIEYAGEVIRSNLTDKREKYYTEKGIGCYMFRIDDHFVVDATMKGNAARFINHSCEPNCYSRVVDILGKKHIVIFALRRISVMEELTYDYKFPFEDEKISCHCLSRKCRKYLN